MYSQRKEKYEGKADEVVPDDDILTLYAEQLVGNRTMTDEQLEELGKIAHEAAFPSSTLLITLYTRQRELRKRLNRNERVLEALIKQWAKGEQREKEE